MARLGPVARDIKAIGVAFLSDESPLPTSPTFPDDSHLLAADPLVIIEEKLLLLDRADERGATRRAWKDNICLGLIMQRSISQFN